MLECTVTFAYDRYYFGAIDSRSRSMTSTGLQNDGAVGSVIETGEGGFADQTGANLTVETNSNIDTSAWSYENMSQFLNGNTYLPAELETKEKTVVNT